MHFQIPQNVNLFVVASMFTLFRNEIVTISNFNLSSRKMKLPLRNVKNKLHFYSLKS